MSNVNIKCNKCSGKMFIDDTFDSYELFCIICGKRDFITQRHPMYGIVSKSVNAK